MVEIQRPLEGIESETWDVSRVDQVEVNNGPGIEEAVDDNNWMDQLGTAEGRAEADDRGEGESGGEGEGSCSGSSSASCSGSGSGSSSGSGSGSSSGSGSGSSSGSGSGSSSGGTGGGPEYLLHCSVDTLHENNPDPGNLTSISCGRQKSDDDFSDDVTITYELSGKATRNVDYSSPANYGTLIIPAAGEGVEDHENAFRQILVVDDDYYEYDYTDPEYPDETIVFEIINVVSSKGHVYQQFAGVGILYDNDLPKAPGQSPPGCGCSAGGDTGLVQGAGTGASHSGSDTGFSENPVRYSDGTVLVRSTDLVSDGFGMPWGITRSWTNTSGYAQGTFFGSGWVVDEQPQLVQPYVYDEQANPDYQPDPDTYAVIANGHTSYYFDWAEGAYESRGFGQERLKNTGISYFEFTDTSGARFLFHDFSTAWPNHLRGRLSSYYDAHNNAVSLNYDTITGLLTSVVRSSYPGLESLEYEYWQKEDNGPFLDNQGAVRSVTQKKFIVGTGWQTVRTAEYEYYDAGDDHGDRWDLRTVTIKDKDGNVLDTTYYRYYVESEAGGYLHGLKYVVNPASFERLTTYTANLNPPKSPFDATDQELATFADFYFEYDGTQRATKEAVAGASGLVNIGYEYTVNGTLPSSYEEWDKNYNHWYTETIETLPDGNRNIVYTNYMGQVMLKVFHDPDTDQGGPDVDRKWSTFYQYDNEGRVVLKANPSAVTGYNSNYYDLLHENSSNYEFLSDSTGLITKNTYYTTLDATETTPGGVPGYLESVSILNGETATVAAGTLLPQSHQNYFWRSTSSNQHLAVLAEQTEYPTAGSTSGGLVTSHEYTFYPDKLQVKSQTTTDPSDDGSIVFYDKFGRPIWSKDPAGFISYTEYDANTGAVIKTIVDVDTEETSTFDDLPDDWETPSGGGLHLTTLYEVDTQGRTTKLTDANDNVTYTVYNDANHEVRTYPGWNSTTNTSTGPTIITREDHLRSYTETLTTSNTPHLTDNRPDGTESVTTASLQSLTRTYVNAHGQQVRKDDYYSFSSMTYGTAPYVGLYYETTVYSYDDRGRLIRTAGPGSKVARTIYDSLGRVKSEWRGPSDTVTGTWHEGNAGAMVKVQEYIYDAGGIGDGNLTKSKDALNRETTMAYDFRGRLLTTTLPDPDGTGTQYSSPITHTEYDNLGRVTSTTDALGSETTYAYNAPNRTTTITYPDPDGSGTNYTSHTTVETRNSRGLLESTVDGLSNVTTYSYDGAARQIVITLPDPDGTGSGNPLLSPVTEFEYDGVGNVRYITDPRGNVTEHQYDKANRLKKTIAPDPDGQSPFVHPTTQFVYDAAGWLNTVTDARGKNTSYIYDRLQRLKEFWQPDPDGVGSQYPSIIKTHFGYDAAGRKTSEFDPQANFTFYFYDAFDRVTQFIQPDPDDTSPFNNPTTSYTYTTTGQLATMTDPAGKTTNYYYDNLDRLIQVVQPDPDGSATEYSAPVTEYTYDANGNLLTVEDPLGNVTTYAYDKLNRRISTTTADPDGSGTVYTALLTQYSYDANGNLLTVEDPLGNVTTHAYDNLGRRSSVTTPDPDGGGILEASVTEYGYDENGNLATNTDPLGNVTTYAYDTLNRQISVTLPDPDGPSNPLESPVTTYTYDAVGNLLTLTDPVGNVTTWTYDALNRIWTEANELNETRSFKYDPTGDLIERIDREGRKTEYTYDALNRKTAEKWYDGSTLLQTISFTYDVMNRLTQASDPTATYNYTYDALGRVSVQTQDINGLSIATGSNHDIYFENKYNAANSRTESKAKLDATYDFKNTYEFDNLQRLKSLVQQGVSGGNTPASKYFEFTYNDNSQFKRIGSYAGTTNSELASNAFYSYDDMGRLKLLTHSLNTTAPTFFGAGVHAGHAYDYDAASRISWHDTRNDGGLHVYGYDNIGQLTYVDYSFSNDSFEYDANGNRSTSEIGENNQLLSDDAYTYEYDDEGNRVSRTDSSDRTTTYTYDHRNRLTSAEGWLAGPLPEDTRSGTPYDWGEEVEYYSNKFWAQTYTVTEGVLGDFTVWVGAGQPSLHFEWWIEDISAEYGEDYTGVYFGDFWAGSFELVEIQTLASPGEFEFRESIAIHVRIVDDEESEVVIEMDILDKDRALYEDATEQFFYDYQNQLVKTIFDIDGAGSEPAETTFYSYENGQVALQFDGTAAADLAHRYLWGPNVDQLLADENVTSLTTAGTIYWPMADHLGSIRDVATHDSSTHATTVILHKNFDAFGNVIAEVDPATNMPTYPADGPTELFSFTGRQFDYATGLQNNLNRWYDPKAGKWISEDPIGFAAGDANLARYVENSPSNAVDPTGLQQITTLRQTDFNRVFKPDSNVVAYTDTFFPFTPGQHGFDASQHLEFRIISGSLKELVDTQECIINDGIPMIAPAKFNPRLFHQNKAGRETECLALITVRLDDRWIDSKQARFNPDGSYINYSHGNIATKQGDRLNQFMEALLRHENGHLKITELYTRAFKVELSHTSMSVIVPESRIEQEKELLRSRMSNHLTNRFAQVTGQMNRMHKPTYDGATSENPGSDRQRAWDRMFDERLAKGQNADPNDIVPVIPR